MLSNFMDKIYFRRATISVASALVNEGFGGQEERDLFLLFPTRSSGALGNVFSFGRAELFCSCFASLEATLAPNFG